MRITKEQLERSVHQLNEILELPTAAFTKGRPNPGALCLEWAYGGVKLIQIKDHGTRDVLPGFGTKRELFGKLYAMKQGIFLAKGGGS